MKTFPLIILLLALASAALLVGLYWRTTETNRQLDQELSSTKADNSQLGAALSESHQLNEKQRSQLEELDTDLGKTKTALTAARANSVTLQREITQLQQAAEEARRTQRQLRTEVTSLNEALAAARAHPASPESIASYQQTIRDLEQQLASAQSAARDTAPIPVLVTHRTRSTLVVSVGPSNAFVVLNYGANHGALPAQTMSIHRGTNLLATVQISDVRENYSIAQVRPDSLRDSLQKGDVATLTP